MIGPSRHVLDEVPLRCPVCRADLVRRADGSRPGSLGCPAGHTFDVARQGHVTLGTGRPLAGDTAQMVADRKAFLDAGHYRALTDRLADVAATRLPSGDGLVVDVGGGTGQHLAEVLERAPRAHGLVVDTATPALRQAARSHPRAAAVGWDVWGPWPLPDGVVDLLVNVFAPRNAAEFRRVLRPTGTLVVVTPTPEHLAEIRAQFPMLAVDDRKPQRLEQTLGSRFQVVERQELTFGMTLPPDDVVHAVAMGPTAFHLEENRAGAPPLPVTALPASGLAVTASFVVTVLTPS